MSGSSRGNPNSNPAMSKPYSKVCQVATKQTRTSEPSLLSWLCYISMYFTTLDIQVALISSMKTTKDFLLGWEILPLTKNIVLLSLSCFSFYHYLFPLYSCFLFRILRLSMYLYSFINRYWECILECHERGTHYIGHIQRIK